LNGSRTRFAYTFHGAERIDLFVVYDNQPGTAAQISAKLLLTLP
jgi:hypothetical protein